MRAAIKTLVILSFAMVLCSGYAPAATKATSKSATHGHRKGKRKASWKKKGQQGINCRAGNGDPAGTDPAKLPDRRTYR